MAGYLPCLDTLSHVLVLVVMAVLVVVAVMLVVMALCVVPVLVIAMVTVPVLVLVLERMLVLVLVRVLLHLLLLVLARTSDRGSSSGSETSLAASPPLVPPVVRTLLHLPDSHTQMSNHHPSPSWALPRNVTCGPGPSSRPRPLARYKNPMAHFRVPTHAVVSSLPVVHHACT